MLNADAMVEQMAASFAAGTKYTDPYALTVFHPFSDDVYSQIQANLPKTGTSNP